MKAKILVLVTSLLSLLASLHLHYVAGYVIDEYNLSGTSYYGGEVGLLLSWLRLLLLAVCVIASLRSLFKKT